MFMFFWEASKFLLYSVEVLLCKNDFVINNHVSIKHDIVPIGMLYLFSSLTYLKYWTIFGLDIKKNDQIFKTYIGDLA